jgi:predicted nucleic acid-binding protein
MIPAPHREAAPGDKAFEVLEGSSDESIIQIPTIVLAELMYISKKGRVILTFKETINRIEQNDYYEIIPLDMDVLYEADKINFDLEMHDKLIVASALIHEAVLITKDEQIKNTDIVKIIW